MAKTEPFDAFTAEYEEWFEKHHLAYLSELKAVRRQFSRKESSIEIGAGTARFAAPLEIDVGVEPSIRMREIARDRGLSVVDAVAERLPFDDAEFDSALMVTTICFLDDVAIALAEAYRILKRGGSLVVGFIDRESWLGQHYQQHSGNSPFYHLATFYSGEEVEQLLEQTGFQDITFVQTVFQDPSNMTEIAAVRPGYGVGSFVVAKGVK